MKNRIEVFDEVERTVLDQVSGDGICPEIRSVKKAGRNQEVPWSP